MINSTKAIFILVLLSLLAGCKKEEGEDFKDRDDKIIQEYLAAHDLTAQRTESGLYYIILGPGSANKPDSKSNVTVDYKGYLTNGDVFDSTEGSQPMTFSLSSVIEGWREGLQLFGEGSSGILIIPSHLGYGNTTLPRIPANSVLIFDIHLINVE